MDNSESAGGTKMHKVLCAVMMLALATAGPAFAQNETSAAASGSTGTSVPSPTSKEEPGLYGSKIIGLKVFDKDGEHVGSIKDVLIAHNQLQK